MGSELSKQEEKLSKGVNCVVLPGKKNKSAKLGSAHLPVWHPGLLAATSQLTADSISSKARASARKAARRVRLKVPSETYSRDMISRLGIPST